MPRAKITDSRFLCVSLQKGKDIKCFELDRIEEVIQFQ